MQSLDSPEPPRSSRTNGPIRRWLGLIGISLGLTALIALATAGFIWRHALASSLTARWIRIHVYEELLAAYIAAAILAPIGLAVLAPIGLRARRHGDRRLAARAGRAFLACLGLMIGLVLCEAVCAVVLHRAARVVHPSIFLTQSGDLAPVTNPQEDRPLQRAGAALPDDETIDVATIGGSSAHGVPFHPWLSLDRIIGWQLRRVFPNATIREDNRAEPGLTLERAVERLSGLTRRPDLLIIYSGHNEFQSRFGWGRKAPHYRIEPAITPPLVFRRVRTLSFTAEFLGRNADRFGIETAPPPRTDRDAGDSPCCTPAEYAATLADYRRRLNALLDDCAAAGITTIVVAPPANDGAFDPNHSVLSPETSLADQRDFIKRLEAVARTAAADPRAAMVRYRDLIAEQPGFAETHYRLARLLEAAGAYAEAHAEYIQARDLDGVPFRCPTPFLEVCRETANRRGNILVDAPRLLEAAAPHGIIDDRFFVDAHHPSLTTFAIIAQDALRQLKERGAFGWPEAVPAPQVSAADCAARFHLDAEAWSHVCANARNFYNLTAVLPRDPSWRRSVAVRYEQAGVRLRAGESPDETGVPALQIHADPTPRSSTVENEPGARTSSSPRISARGR